MRLLSLFFPLRVLLLFFFFFFFSTFAWCPIVSGTDKAASGDGSSVDRLHDLGDPSPFSVLWYIKQYFDMLDGRRFRVMRLAGNCMKFRMITLGVYELLPLTHCKVGVGLGLDAERLNNYENYTQTNAVDLEYRMGAHTCGVLAG